MNKLILMIEFNERSFVKFFLSIEFLMFFINVGNVKISRYVVSVFEVRRLYEEVSLVWIVWM